MWWPRVSVRWALCASALLHLGGVVALSDVAPPPRRAAAPAPRREVVPFEPVIAGTPTGLAERPSTSAPPLVVGGEPLAGVLDRREPEGRGGEAQAPEQGARLFPFVSPLTLQDTELNNLAVNQAQRIDTAEGRASLEARRATPNPADAVLLASGTRGHEERRTPARTDALEGAPRPAQPSMPGEDRAGQTAALAFDSEGPTAEPARTAERAARLRPAQGIQHGRGRTARSAAQVARARPNVDRGPAATPAEQVDARVHDDQDAELLAAKLQRSLVDTSVQQAKQTGPGTGGVADESRALGEHGTGTGAHARPYAPGLGNSGALDTSDARYVRWFTDQRARVQRELVFPRERAIMKDQGTTLYSVELGRDGALTQKPRLIRSSGFKDFDKAAERAIERALPFAPLPAQLAPAVDRIAVLIPVAFSNPMVE